jgi:hypothetical protein
VDVATLLRESPDPTVDDRVPRGHGRRARGLLALAALVLHRLTGSALPDALATLAIGCLLVYLR